MSFPDPEVLHGKLTAGDLGAVRSVGAVLSDAKSSLRSASASLSSGAVSAAERWRGEAAESFVAKAQESSTAAAAVYRQLHTAEAALGEAADAHTTLRESADAAIAPWRRTTDLADDERRELALRTIRELMTARQSYESRLATLAAKLDTPDPGGGEWDQLQLSGSGPDQAWTHQGLAYDGDNLLVTSYFDLYGRTADPDGNASRLTLVDYDTGLEEKDIFLGGKGNGAPPNHAGGVATDGEHVWVTSTVDNGDGTKRSEIYVYDKSEIDDAKPDESVPAKHVIETPASSYVSYADNKLWVGEYNADDEGKLYELDVDPDDGRPITHRDDDDYPPSHATPDHVQGVLVREDELVFTQSSGHDGKLVTQDRHWDGTDNWLDPLDGPHRNEIDLDGYGGHGIEEIVEIDGDIVTAHEAGADNYDFTDTDDKYGEPELIKTPLDELGLDESGALAGQGYDTDPDSLVSAAGSIDEATATLVDTASSMSGLRVPPIALAEVPAAARFADAATRFIADVGGTVRAGSTAVGSVADELVSSAEAYRKLDTAASSLFGKLGGAFD